MKTRYLFAGAVIVVAAALATTASAKRETGRQIVDRFFIIVDAKQTDRLAEVEAADFVMQTPMGTMKGVAGHQQLLTGFATAFPNFKHTNSRCIESGDLVSCEGVFSGDHTGPMMMPDGKSVPPTKKHVQFGYAGIAQVKGGKLVEMHVYFDNLDFMRQLGLIPAPSAGREVKGERPRAPV